MQNNDYIKDADGNPVYSNIATFTCAAPKADELKVITGLTNYKTNINGFYFRFDPTLDTETDDYELQYAKDAEFKNIIGSKENGSIIYASEIETDVNYYVRAITYRIENGETKYAKAASNTVTIKKAKYPSITKLAVTEKDFSGYTFKYEGSLNSYRSGAEVWLSTDPSFKNDGSSTRTFYIGGGYYDDDDEDDVITSGCSAAATASVSNTTIGKTKITSGKSSKGKVNLKWQKVNGAAGYVVYRSTKKGSRYTKIAEITKGSTVKYTDKTAKKGKKYYYKVRAVKANEAGVDVQSGNSAAKAVKAK